MNIIHMLVVVGFVLIQVSAANAQFGGVGNLLNKQLNTQNTNRSGNATTPPATPPQNNQSATPPPNAPVAQNDQNATVATPALTPNANDSQQKAKAYKTLNFGDNAEIAENKLAEIIDAKPVDYNNPFHHDPGSGSIDSNETYDDDRFGETFSRSLFDTDAEYEPNKFNHQHGEFPESFKPLMNYFKHEVGITVVRGGNNVISLNCFLLNSKPHGNSGLAIVEVSYITFDLDKLVDGFMQNYPNAKKQGKSYQIESTMYPGVFLEFERTLFSDINQDRRATLSLPTKKFTFTFTELSKLSNEQLGVWDSLMTKDGKTTQRNEYYESMKTAFLGFAKDIESEKPTGPRLEPLTYQGWYDNPYYESIIYGRPSAVFASKKILDLQVSNYRQSIQAEDQKKKEQLKKQSDGVNSF